MSGTQQHFEGAPQGRGVVVHLFGCFQVTVDDAVVPLVGGAQRLVALLALRGRTGRSRLAGSLWPTSTEARALASLRTAIWRANRCLPGLVESAPHSVALEAETGVDVARMINASHAVLTGADTTRTLDDPANTAADLLPDWEDDWLHPERERLRQLRLHVLEAQAHRHTAEGAYGLALEWALAAVREDPLRESAHRAVMRVHLAEGNLGQARQAYARLVQTLARELDLAPSEQTMGLLRPVDRRVPGARPPRQVVPGTRPQAQPAGGDPALRRAAAAR